MLLESKTAIVYGAGGAIGAAVSRAFAREGATIYLAGHNLDKVEMVAKEITAEGGRAYAHHVDALDGASVDAHAETVVAEAGRLDISFNAVGLDHIQGVPLRDMSLDDFLMPINIFVRTQFVTATAAARQMAQQGSGVVVILSTSAARAPMPSGGFGVACAGIESLSRELAGEMGPFGVRVVCLRPDAIPESVQHGSYVRQTWRRAAEANGATLEDMLAAKPGMPNPLLGRAVTLADVAGTAVYLASDLSSGLTGSITTVGCGVLVD
ncbi:SDR family oxidoreductase [Micromonospora sp. HNM0581]|uniref:SDR family NAD(P)-dependent oxidoreductase n=1 Tax=Micromonospora sp. HNM0581 TaxID=2716341 RepID=UPI00146A9BCD|nr:SDR family oxidoreductase [Micromonospora sp. HNM0581]NLU79159.1 SDR family oxidoreductase [Micromonospora sp. HNM0581]